eukprot:m.1428746 g.1428746  ORF g.1428746 m.1428746 type:complete len:1842 (-) comp25067_c0_seq5:2397-7922(-)
MSARSRRLTRALRSRSGSQSSQDETEGHGKGDDSHAVSDASTKSTANAALMLAGNKKHTDGGPAVLSPQTKSGTRRSIRAAAVQAAVAARSSSSPSTTSTAASKLPPGTEPGSATSPAPTTAATSPTRKVPRLSNTTSPKQTPQLSMSTIGSTARKHASESSPPVYQPCAVAVEEDWLEERLKTLEAPSGNGYDGMGDIIDSYLVLHTANRELGFMNHPEYLQDRARRFAEPLLRHIVAAPPDVSALSEDAQDPHSKAVPYSQPPELNLAQAALRWTGFFLSQTNIVRQLDLSLQTRFIQALLSNLKNHAFRDKSTINLTIWCLTVQSLARETISSHVPDIIAALDLVFDAKFNSASVEHEALRTYLRLLDQVPDAMGQTAVAVQWGTRTIARLTSDAIGVRRKALDVMHAGIAPLTVAYRSTAARNRLVRYLKHHDYAALATLKAHAGTTNADDKQVFLVKAWTYLITLLGPGAKLARTDGRALGNRLLALLYAPFKMGSPVLEHTLTAWSVLVDVLTQPYTEDETTAEAGTTTPTSPPKVETLSTSTVRMLLKPLVRPLDAAMVAKGTVNVPLVNDARVRAWWHLVTNVPKATTVANEARHVFFPLLRFVLDDATGDATVGVEDLHLDILTHIATARGAPTATTALRALPTPVSDDIIAIPEVTAWVVASVRHVVAALPAHPDRLARVVAVSAELASRIHTMHSGSAAQASALFAKLATALGRGWTPLPPLTSAVVQVVNAVVREVPAVLLCAPKCAMEPPAGLLRTGSADSARISPLEFFASVVLGQGPDDNGAGDTDVYAHAEFAETFNCLVRGASASPLVLRYVAVLVHHMAALGPRLPQPAHALKYWEKLGNVLVKSPEVHEGEEHAPEFTSFVRTLVLPLQWAERQPAVLRAPDFVKKWGIVLDAFCLGAVVLPCGSRYHNLACLNEALLHIDFGTLATDEHAVAAAFACLAAIMDHVKSIRSPTAELAYGAGPQKLGGLLHHQLRVMERAMEVGNRKLAALGWPQQLAYYETVLVAFNTLIDKFNHPTTIEGVAERILPKLLDLLAHAFKAQNTASKALNARAPRVGLPAAIVRLWQTVAQKLAVWIDPSPTKGADAGLGALVDMFVVTFGHSQPAVVEAAATLWNTTFGEQPWMVVPPALQTAIAKATRHGAQVHVPSEWLESQNMPADSLDDSMSSTEAANASPAAKPSRSVRPTATSATTTHHPRASAMRVGAARSPNVSPRPKRRSFLHRSDMGTPRTLEVTTPGHAALGSPSRRKAVHARATVSSLSPVKFSPSNSPKKVSEMSSPSKKRLNVYDEDSQKFVNIVPSPKKSRTALTPHQRERKKEQRIARRERVTLYTNNEESQDTLADSLDTLVDEIDPLPTASTASDVGMNTRSTRAAAATHRPPVQPSFAVPTQPASTAGEGQLSPPSILKRKAGAPDPSAADTRRRRRRVSFDLEQNRVHIDTPEPRKGGMTAGTTGTTSAAGTASDTGSAATPTPTHGAVVGGTRPVPNAVPVGAAASVGVAGSSQALLSTPVDVGKNAFFSSPPPVGLSPLVVNGSKTRSRGEMMISTLSASPTRTIKSNIISESPAPLVPMRVLGAQRSLEPAFQSRQPSQTPDVDQGIFPSLSSCSQPVTEILPFFSATMQRRAVKILLTGKKVNTVGHFCSLSRKEFELLPLKLTSQTHGELYKYQQKLSQEPTHKAQKSKSHPLVRTARLAPSPATRSNTNGHVNAAGAKPRTRQADVPSTKQDTLADPSEDSSASVTTDVTAGDGGSTRAPADGDSASILHTLTSLSSASHASNIGTLPKDQLLAMQKTLTDLMHKVGTAIAPSSVQATPAAVASEL